jgi:peptidoglycan/LPS O-acetylase OafA/YrhL
MPPNVTLSVSKSMSRVSNSTVTIIRQDIQVLRGFAVLLVLIFHAKLGIFNAGYLGVDIFFVISGFLISKLIREGMESGTFSFSGFYLRRAKRLLPSAYFTFFTTTMIAPWFLTVQQLADYKWQLLGALTFTANMVLWRQSGYFESASEMMPLLHIWSLSIEEQYYFLLPAAFFLIHPNRWVKFSCFAIGLSLLLCYEIGSTKPSASFYLLSTRGWELGIGSLGALTQHYSYFRKMLPRLFFPAIAILLILPAAPLSANHPGIDAILVCVATLIVIAAEHREVFGSVLGRVMAWFGNISYSLYLVHWPIFAFVNCYFYENVPLNAKVAAVALSIALGYFQFALVETPFKTMNIALAKNWLIALVLFPLTLALSFVIQFELRESKVDYAQIFRGNYGFGAKCDYSDDFAAFAECQNSAEPKIIVWGDSYAMHLVPGLVSDGATSVVQATMSSCGPVLDLALTDNSTHPVSWSQQCVRFNHSVIEYISHTKSIEIVVLSGALRRNLADDSDAQIVAQNIKTIGASTALSAPNMNDTVLAMTKTIREIRKLGKKVVVVAPLPNNGINIAHCIERRATGLVTSDPMPNCQILEADYRKYDSTIIHFYDALKKSAGVDVINPADTLCTKSVCETTIGRVPLYRDAGHLSVDGSRALAKQMDLVSMMSNAAK